MTAASDQHNLPLQQIQGLIQEAQEVAAADRRNRDRFPLCCTMQLTPIDHDGVLLHYESMEVVGKDLSVTGICFSHNQQLSHTRAVISLNHPKVGRFVVEVRIVWTRRTPIGLYESGCRMIRRAEGHMLCVK